MTPAQFFATYDDAFLARRAVEKGVELTWPVGSRIPYEWRGLKTSGIVRQHGFFGRVFVTSDRGASYWIEPHHIAAGRP